MSANFQTFIDCFNILSDQSGQNHEEAEQKLNELFSDPSIFPELIEFATLDGIPLNCRNHAAVHIGRLFKQYFNDFELEEQTSIFSSLLDLLIFPGSDYVRRYIKYFVQMGMNTDFIPLGIEFVNQQKNNLNDIGLEASLNLLSLMLLHQEEATDLAPISIPLIEEGINSKSINVRLASVLHGLVIANIMESEDGPQLLSQYVDSAVQLLADFVNSNDKSFFDSLCELVKGMKYLFDQEPEEIDGSQILHACFELISNDNINPVFHAQVLDLTNVLIKSNIQSIAEDEDSVQTILQVYFEYEKSIYDPDEQSIDLVDDVTFPDAIELFAQYPHILELMWNMMTSIVETQEGFFASIIAISYSLDEGRDFYQSKINDLQELFIQGINNDVLIINEAAARAITNFAFSQKRDIKSVSDAIITVLLEKLTTDQNVEFVKSINSIALSAEDIGPIFSSIFDAYSSLFDTEDLSMKYSILDGLYELVRNSPTQARHAFQPISELCFQLINSTDKNDEFKDKAISILAFLIECSPKLFSDLFTDFHQIVVDNMNSDDLSILKESIIAYGHLTGHYIDQMESSIETVYPKLIENAKRDIAEKLESDQEIFTGEDDEGDLDKRIDPLIDVVTASIRVASNILSNFPDMIESEIEPLLDAIEEQLSRGDADCTKGCAEGCQNLIEGIQKIGFSDRTKPLLSKIVGLLDKIVSSDNCTPIAVGAAFTGISDIIAGDKVLGMLCCYDNLESILEAVRAVFCGEMLYQQGRNRYDEDLHQPAMRVIREIIAAMENESLKVVEGLVPIFNGLVDNDSIEMRDLILQFFGDLSYWASDATDDELKNNTFILAYDAIEKRNSAIGYGCIKQLAEKVPDVITDKLKDILGLIKDTLDINEENPTESLQSSQDNAVSALGMIAKNILKDEFPINDFLQSALNKMPAQMEVEENNDHIDFFFWLYQMAGISGILNDNIKNFAAVPIRLFSDPIDKLDEYYVSQENIERMLNILLQFASTISQFEDFENFVNEVCENDEFKVESVADALNIKKKKKKKKKN